MHVPGRRSTEFSEVRQARRGRLLAGVAISTGIAALTAFTLALLVTA